MLLFLYQTLDGSDGKQARKTQTGSALGELMDHGIDSWTVAPIALVVVDAILAITLFVIMKTAFRGPPPPLDDGEAATKQTRQYEPVAATEMRSSLA